MGDHAASDRLVATARGARPDLLIMVRARDSRHAAHLYAIGATDAVPETIEASLQLAEAVLVEIGVAMGPVIATIHEHRAELQAEIKAMAPHAEVRDAWPAAVARYAVAGGVKERGSAVAAAPAERAPTGTDSPRPAN